MKTVFILLGILITLVNCRNSKTTQETIQKPPISYQDSVFLKIEEDMSNPDVAWDRNIYGQAYERFLPYIYISGDTLAWSIKNGAEIKISENIYNYIVDAMIYNNEINLPSGKYDICQEKKTGYYYVIMKNRTPDLDSIYLKVNIK